MLVTKITHSRIAVASPRWARRRATGVSGPRSEPPDQMAWYGHLPARHGALLGSLSCWLCGAISHAECDMATHQQYANAQFGCSVCGAPPQEVCLPDCPAANTLLDVYATVQHL